MAKEFHILARAPVFRIRSVKAVFRISVV